MIVWLDPISKRALVIYQFSLQAEFQALRSATHMIGRPCTVMLSFFMRAYHGIHHLRLDFHCRANLLAAGADLADGTEVQSRRILSVSATTTVRAAQKLAAFLSIGGSEAPPHEDQQRRGLRGNGSVLIQPWQIASLCVLRTVEYNSGGRS